MPAVADDEGGLVGPFVIEVVDCVFYAGRVAPVVLGQDEDEGGVGLDFEREGLGVRVGVGGVGGDLRGDGGFVEEGEVPG